MKLSIGLGIISCLVTCLSIAQDQVIDQGDLEAANNYYQAAQEALFSDDYDRAILRFQQAVELNEGNADYWYGMSNAFTLKEVLDSALLAVEKAISLAPGQADYYTQAGHIAYRMGNYEVSIEAYAQALEHAETGEVAINKGHVYYNRGVCFFKLKRYHQAVLEFKFAERAGNEEVPLFHNRGLAYLRAGKLNEACMDFNKAKAMGSQMSDSYLKDCE